jgi:hypothetical protein
MKTLNQKIIDVSFHIQSLAAPEFCSEVQEALEKKDKNLLIRVCRKAKVPVNYVGTVVSTLFTMSSDQPKWPEFF